MNIIEEINQLHEDNEHEKIIDIITEIPEDERSAELFSLLARAYNNIEKYDKALDNLMYRREEGIDDALWNYRVGYAYYYKGDKENAEMYFKKAYDLNNDDTDAYNFYMLCSEDKDDGINFEERVNRFWKWFEENEKVISDFIEQKSNMSSEEIIEFVSNGVALISNNLQFVFGGNYEFTFTVEGKEYLFYFTPRIVGAMPEKLKSKWKFFPYMQKQDIANSNFRMYNKDLSFKEILVYPEYDEDTNFFNLKFYNKKLNELEEDYAYNAFYIMLEHAVGENISKVHLLDVESRCRLISDIYASEPRVSVRSYGTLTGEFAMEVGACAIVRGIRNTTDFNFERSIEATNRRLFPSVTTVLLVTPDEYAHISSSIVRELVSFGHDVGEFMPKGVRLSDYMSK